MGIKPFKNLGCYQCESAKHVGVYSTSLQMKTILSMHLSSCIQENVHQMLYLKQRDACSLEANILRLEFVVWIQVVG
jgi:hypothetical protein